MQSELAQWAQGSATGSRGWEELVGTVEVHEIEAEHFSLLKSPAISCFFFFFQQTLVLILSAIEDSRGKL